MRGTGSQAGGGVDRRNNRREDQRFGQTRGTNSITVIRPLLVGFNHRRHASVGWQPIGQLHLPHRGSAACERDEIRTLPYS
jgi:hypothetical protein